jgi:formylglycine-generating enzyme required for sulfatase activity
VETKTYLTCTIAMLGILGALATTISRADDFGSDNHTFRIDFNEVGNAGNANDAGAGGGSYFSPYGGVAYNFRIGTYEISQDMIERATASGMTRDVTAGAWAGNRPAANITWIHAAGFVNWLNTSTGHQKAYDITEQDDYGRIYMTLWSSAQAWQTGGENLYRHKDAFYFLPSENEWYKAAYHKNDGVTANYWDYATSSNITPKAVASGMEGGTAVYNGMGNQPAPVTNSGGFNVYGAMGMTGNVYEFNESAFDAPNDDPYKHRVVRGGAFAAGDYYLNSSLRFNAGLTNVDGADDITGFRVASISTIIPEPSAAVMILMAVGAWLLIRRSRRFL